MQTLYSGGLLFDGDGRLLENYGVLVENDRIVKIAPRPEFTGFAGYVVDTSGGTLLPSLIDTAVHVTHGGEANPFIPAAARSDAAATLVALENVQASLIGGVGVVRDLGGRADVGRAVSAALDDGRFMGASLMTAGQTITATGGHGHDTGAVADGAPAVVQAVRKLVSGGASTIVLAASGGVTTGDDPWDGAEQREMLNNVLGWLLLNSMRSEHLQHMQLSQQCLHNVWRRRAFMRLLSAGRHMGVGEARLVGGDQDVAVQRDLQAPGDGRAVDRADLERRVRDHFVKE